ncbi:unnamed protein product [Rhizoctonia solani]|uniref:DNA repair metallo-beta-lactamase domain-containing protein n=1 Tax=Rhizoctonia solani TaxID=456999 RepID=A0A8H3B4E2_9AGAM|nr:unnamed protein product [Rhizoctonia solani]
MRTRIGLIHHHRGVSLKRPQWSLTGFYVPYALPLVPSPGLLNKHKQNASVREPHVLLNLFNPKRFSPVLGISTPATGTTKTTLECSEVTVFYDEVYTRIVPVEDVLDLTFSDSVDNADFTPIDESLKCLGNQISSDSIDLGTCGTCGLLLLDATEKEINEHDSECFAKSTEGPSGNPSRSYTMVPQANPSCKTPRSSSSTLKKSNPLNPFILSRQKDAWNTMDVGSSAKRGTRAYTEGNGTPITRSSLQRKKTVPSYKIMPGMPIAVDAFSYGKIPGVTAYFLSHAHSDHYTNLSSSWDYGPVYCSLTTGNLIKHMRGVDPKWVKPLPENKAIEIPDTGGVTVTLIGANHCPGSSLFVFSGRQTIDAGDPPVKSPFVGSDRQFTYLHCGDFRACPAHTLHPAIHGKKLDAVYLDTTYLNPQYCFPPQAMVIDACAELAKRYVQDDMAIQGQSVNPAGRGASETLDRMQTGTLAKSPSIENLDTLGQRVLVVVGTYTIGKERLIKAIAEALSSKIYCNSDKHAVFLCQADADLHAMLTMDPAAAQVHVLPLRQISIEGLSEYLTLHQAQYDRILGFKPTGWTYTSKYIVRQNIEPTINQTIARARAHKYDVTDLRPQWGSNPRVAVYGVPYSEHSSFRELTCFALSVDWSQIIATANVRSDESCQKMQIWYDKWAKARRDRAGEMVKHRSADYW